MRRLAIGIVVVLSMMAALVFKMRGFAELTALLVHYVSGFGWIIPMPPDLINTSFCGLVQFYRLQTHYNPFPPHKRGRP